MSAEWWVVRVFAEPRVLVGNLDCHPSEGIIQREAREATPRPMAHRYYIRDLGRHATEQEMSAMLALVERGLLCKLPDGAYAEPVRCCSSQVEADAFAARQRQRFPRFRYAVACMVPISSGGGQ